MKHLLAAATFTALLAAAPASAQVAYGMVPGETATVTGFSTGGNWRDAVVIYAGSNTGSTVLDNAIAPLTTDAGAATPAGVSFDLGAGSSNAGLTGFSGGSDAVVPVPEPATWAMMLVGFGAVGGMLRSRRKATIRYA
ncbi:MAG: PEPxxWA-CTERM sorting domain-containing protein [Sphingomonas sp.]|uniref:PEPxxWA-CTERM sorting domain-containing protein n=1 Tax=Sphingomonas sp. TaxID=28214 RepID=UPI001AC2153D|nr:PEPxxWA-CTERM sorting domain-containing protein [Sphingomonas sp.]MBN8815554.1 PEPxxWA-CTERM sorting domain-containing protein [Sphingomonas sp.]